MDLTIDPDAATPPYAQLRTRVEELITTGELSVGDRLPPVRALAAELGLANGTIARAYRELEQDGLIETRGRAGTRVAGMPERRAGELRAMARDYVDRAGALGVSAVEIRAAVDHALGS